MIGFIVCNICVSKIVLVYSNHWQHSLKAYVSPLKIIYFDMCTVACHEYKVSVYKPSLGYDPNVIWLLNFISHYNKPRLKAKFSMSEHRLTHC